MIAPPPRVEVTLPHKLVMTLDRAPVRFVLSDCFKMAFVVGAGLLLGMCAVVGGLALLRDIVRVIAA